MCEAERWENTLVATRCRLCANALPRAANCPCGKRDRQTEGLDSETMCIMGGPGRGLGAAWAGCVCVWRGGRESCVPGNNVHDGERDGGPGRDAIRVQCLHYFLFNFEFEDVSATAPGDAMPLRWSRCF